MNRLLHRLQHALILATSVGLVLLAWMWQPWAGMAASLLCALGLWAGTRKGLFTLPPEDQERAAGPAGMDVARTMVTHLLKDLTRVQVAYLCQDFSSPGAGKSWLKRRLPGAFHASLKVLHRDLEAARAGEEVDSLRLARRILDRRADLRELEEALESHQEAHPGHALAHPILFVITQDLDGSEEKEPEVITLAGWNPEEATLLPEVDAVSLYSELDAGKKVRGQVTFTHLMDTLSGRLQRLDPEGRIFAAAPQKDPVRAGLRIDKVPLGFTVGTADMLE